MPDAPGKAAGEEATVFGYTAVSLRRKLRLPARCGRKGGVFAREVGKP
jgi:hypothetical protein